MENFTKAIAQMIREEHFCDTCESLNVRAKVMEYDPETEEVNITCACNDCDAEWVEHFKLVYKGYTNARGIFVPDEDD